MPGITNQITIANGIAASQTLNLIRWGRVLWVLRTPEPPAAQTANSAVEPTPDTAHRFLKTNHGRGLPLR